MSLVNLAHVCSHLQNVSKARLGTTAIPFTKLHLDLMLALQKQGFLASVTPAGLECPLPNSTGSFIPEEDPYTDNNNNDNNNNADSSSLPSSSSPSPSSPSTDSPSPTTTTTTPDPLLPLLAALPANPAHRRIWLGMKYWKAEPVLSKMSMVSKPTRRIMLQTRDLAIIARGRESAHVKGLSKIGECLFVKTGVGVLEARECVERSTGGLVLCRGY